MVDIISGGRLELGLGAGYRVPEFELFGTDFAAGTGSSTRRSASSAGSGASGRPHPGPGAGAAAGLARLPGAQGGPAGRPDGRRAAHRGRRSWPHYRDGLAEGGHDPAAARMGGGIQAYVTDDPERDWPLVAPHIAYQQDSYRKYMVEGTGSPAPRPVDPERLRTRGPDTGPLSHFLFGTPGQVAAQIRAHLGDAPVRHVWVGASVAGLPEDMAARHVQAICTQLGPLLGGPPPRDSVPAGQDAGGAASPGQDTKG